MEVAVSKAEYDLLKLIHGSKSERFAPASAPEQMTLWEEEQGEAAGAEEQTKENVPGYARKKKKSHPGRTPLPEHLPVRQVFLEPKEDTTGMTKIGEEITRKVDYTPGTLEIIEYVRSKYARPEADQSEDKPAIVIAEVPDQVLPKSIAEVGLLVFILIAKYIDHLPFYRQIGMFQRDHGWTIHKSTINGWFTDTCSLLEPLHEALQKDVLDTDYLQGDESRLLVLEQGKEPKKKTSEKLKRGAKRHGCDGVLMYPKFT